MINSVLALGLKERAVPAFNTAKIPAFFIANPITLASVVSK